MSVIKVDFAAEECKRKLRLEFVKNYAACEGVQLHVERVQDGGLVCSRPVSDAGFVSVGDAVFKISYDGKAGEYVLYQWWETYEWKIYGRYESLLMALNVMLLFHGWFGGS